MIPLRPASQPETTANESKVLSALSGKPAPAAGSPDLFDESGSPASPAIFPAELAAVLERNAEAPGAAATAPAVAPLQLQESTASQWAAERWLQDMQSQQAAVVTARVAGQQHQEEAGDSHRSAAIAVAQALAKPADYAVRPNPAPDADGVSLPQAASSRAELARGAANVAELAEPAKPLLGSLSGAEQPGLQSPAQDEAALAQASAPRPVAAEAATLAAVSSAAQPGPAQLAETALRLQAPEAKWGEQMLQALRQHVEVSLQQGQQQAHIRLDPPELGSLEVFLSHESGRLQVQIGAGHADIVRLLQQTSERLRQELMEQHFVQVEIDVFADGGQQQRSRQQGEWAGDELPLAAAQAADSQQRTSAADHSGHVLVTV